MKVRDLPAVMAAVLVVVLLFTPAAVLADDVKVKTIDPDKPNLDQPKVDQPRPDQPRPLTQPDQSAKPATPATPRVWTPAALIGGDWIIMQAFQAAKVTDEQKEKLKGVLDDLAKEAKDGQSQMSEVYKKLQAAYKAAKDAGAEKPADQAEVKAAMAEVNKGQQEMGTATEKRRERLLEALPGVLSAEQISIVKDTFERYSPNPATRNKSLARDWVRTSSPNVTLTADQQAQIVAKLAPIQEKFGLQVAEIQKAQMEKMQQYMKEDPKTAWTKASQEFAPKLAEVRMALSKALNEAVEGLLTDEQKKQAAEGRQEVWKKSVQGWVDGTVRSFEPAKLTDEQAAKAKALATAAGEAMLKTDMYDSIGREELAGKLREDIKKLLTDEQRAKVR